MTVPGVLSSAECEAVSRRLLGRLERASSAEVRLSSVAIARVDFARGETHMASYTMPLTTSLAVEVAGRPSVAQTNQIDEAGLRTLVARAERAARENPSVTGLPLASPQRYPEGPPIFFDASVAAMAGDAQAALVQRAIEAARAASLVAAGTVTVSVRARAIHNTGGMLGYEVGTFGELSVTARGGAEHRGSGWAWSGFEDWSRVDPAVVIHRAIELGERSARPVAIEPGRYTVILEPAAVAELIKPIIDTPTGYWSEPLARGGEGVFAKEPPGTTKVGLQMMDRRLGMVSSPWDPDRPASTIDPFWRPIPEPVNWFERGVLRNLAHLGGDGRKPVINPGGVRLTAEGPSRSLDDMIAGVRRGIWVNRLSHVMVMDDRTLLLTGTTRDGTFLIEHGKITKPVKNLRFTESPFYVLNRLEAWGEPVRASSLVVAPRLLLRDFNFTSLTDAI